MDTRGAKLFFNYSFDHLEVAKTNEHVSCESGTVCNAKTVRSVVVQRGAERFHMWLCEKHVTALHEARNILDFAVDMHNHRNFKLEAHLDREAAIGRWLRIFVESHAAAFEPDAFAQKAHEFVRAMIDLEDRCTRLAEDSH